MVNTFSKTVNEGFDISNKEKILKSLAALLVYTKAYCVCQHLRLAYEATVRAYGGVDGPSQRVCQAFSRRP